MSVDMPTNKKSRSGLGSVNQQGMSGKRSALAAEDNELAMEPVKTTRGKKRNYSTFSENAEPIDNDMESLITSFGADISKSLDAKRKRLESFTDSSIKASNNKVEEVWTSQRRERYHLGEEYKKQASSVLAHWEAELEKTKAEEMKLLDLLKQHQKLFQQQRMAQTQSLKTIKKLHEQYMKGMEELDSCHKQQQSAMTDEIKEEMSSFQKKVLTETQSRDLSNVKRSLQNMLAQV